MWLRFVPLVLTMAAIPFLLSVFSIGSNKAIEHFNNGVALSADDLWEEAIPEYGEAILLKPDFAEAHINRGAAYSDLGRHVAAIRHFDEAVRLDSENAFAFMNRGGSYITMGNPPHGIED
jgi:protein O-GlcNAc transferase